ncbi:MAG TPA: hypothetical protein VG796_13885 [Verrucomicrobiales bacterium]|nr:hypothetical protein [Verrucomicrobiales bacterium]
MLVEAGFMWQEDIRRIYKPQDLNVNPFDGEEKVSPDSLFRAISRLEPRELNLELSYLANADGLKGLTSLRRLDLSRCYALTNGDGLKSLT